jgi:hypothetical protein
MLGNENNLTKIMKGITISNPKDNTEFEIDQLWARNKSPLLLIHWLRRFG